VKNNYQKQSESLSQEASGTETERDTPRTSQPILLRKRQWKTGWHQDPVVLKETGLKTC